MGTLLRLFLRKTGEGGYPSTLVSEGKGGKWVFYYDSFWGRRGKGDILRR